MGACVGGAVVGGGGGGGPAEDASGAPSAHATPNASAASGANGRDDGTSRTLFKLLLRREGGLVHKRGSGIFVGR